MGLILMLFPSTQMLNFSTLAAHDHSAVSQLLGQGADPPAGLPSVSAWLCALRKPVMQIIEISHDNSQVRKQAEVKVSFCSLIHSKEDPGFILRLVALEPVSTASGSAVTMITSPHFLPWDFCYL